MDTILDQGTYISAARSTVKFVDSTMDIGSSNKLSNMHHFGVVQACVAESRKQIENDLKGQAAELNQSGGSRGKAMVETWANWAKHFGCGNCGEQSALAFVHLRDMGRMVPLDWMQIDSFSHGFVVLGRIGATNPEVASTWNNEAVVCDPWEGYAGAASACSRLRGRKIGLLYRIA